MNQNNEWCVWKKLCDGKLEESLLGVTNPSVYDAKQSDIHAGVFLVEPSEYSGPFSESENEWEENPTESSESDNKGEEKPTSHKKSPPKLWIPLYEDLSKRGHNWRTCQCMLGSRTMTTTIFIIAVSWLIIMFSSTTHEATI